jgi:hypothetical protein
MLSVERQVRKMTLYDELVIACDHQPAATTSIPQYAREANLEIESAKVSPTPGRSH